MPRGFTLLEVIVTLSIVLALSALVMPAVSRRIGGATGEAVTRELRSAVAAMRGDAIRESATLRLEIVVDPLDGGVRIVAREFESAPAAVPARFVGPILDDSPPVLPAEVTEDRLVMELPRGTRVSREQPAVEGDQGSVSEMGATEADLSGGGLELWSEEAADAVCLGVLLPTGGAVAGAAVYITLPATLTLVVRLDPWTGAAVVSRWEPPAPEDEWAMDDDGLGNDTAAGAAERR